MKRIFLIGYMGSGKTSMGKLLAEKLGFTFVDMDAHIEAKYHKTVSQIFAEMGQEQFREIERECLHEVAEFEKSVISTGGGAPCYFNNMEYMNAHGLTIYLNLTIDQLTERLLKSRPGKRPLIDALKGKGLREFIEKAMEVRAPFYAKAQMQLSGDDEEIISSLDKLVASV
ncbi:MAG: shikimate kinase [Paludibacter sp.]|nr:shikimate kinase [Paludibacter sp.]